MKLLNNILTLLCFFVFNSPILTQVNPYTQITTNPDHDVNPDIWYDKIVYETFRNGSWDIYMFDVATEVETPICKDAADQWNPAIWADKIVWQDFRNGNWDIYMYDLTYETEVVVCDSAGWQTNPDIWQTYIVWQDTRYDGGDIYLYDLVTFTEIPICTETSSTPFSDEQTVPSISDWQIVWQDRRNDNDDIYMYNFYTGDGKPICIDLNSQKNPSISGNRIVWEDDRYGNLDIFLYYLNYYLPYSSNDLEWPLTLVEIDRVLSNPANQRDPHIYADKLVFHDDRAGDEDVYLFAFDWKITGNMIPIAAFSQDQEDPVVWDDIVVWEDNRAGIANKDIYMWERPPGADLSISLRDEPDPVKVDEYLTYTLNVKNSGPADASGVVVIDTIPTGVEYISATTTQGNCDESGGLITCNIDSLLNGDIATITIVVRTTAKGTITNRAVVTGNEYDDITINNDAIRYTKVLSINMESVGEGWAPSVAADASGHAHLSYTRDGVGGTVVSGSYLLYMWQDDIRYATNESGFWHSEILYDGYDYNDPPPVINPHHYSYKGWSSDIVIDSADDVHLVYVVYFEEKDITSQTENAKYTIYYRKRERGIWQTKEEVKVIDEVINGNWQYNSLGSPLACSALSIGLESNQNVHISYKNTYGGPWQGELIHLTNSSGIWTSEIVHPEIYTEAKMVVDADDFLHFSFYSWNINPSGPLAQGIGYLTNAPSGIWQSPEPIETNWSGGQMEPLKTDMAVDLLNRPHVSYSSGAGIPREDTRYAIKINGLWDTTQIDIGDFYSSYNSIDVDPDTNAHICYLHVPTEELRYATNVSGSWVIEQIDNGPWYWSNLGSEGYQDVKIDRSGGFHLGYDKDGKIKYVYNSQRIDGDHDGIPDSEEQGPDGTNLNYDGNSDGLPDHQQGNVASFHTNDGSYYVTLENPDTTITLANTEAVNKPAPSDPGAPTDEETPYGFFKFTLLGLNVGDTTYVNLILHGGPTISTYYKYSPTPDSSINHWYQFTFDGSTGAIFHGDTVIIHFIDGQRGDRDILANGVIQEPGGPGLTPSVIGNSKDLIPTEFILYQNYPNPFNSSTIIRYDLPKSANVEITIFNILGQKVYTYRINNQIPGAHRVVWDGRNSHGNYVATGIYISRMNAGKFVSHKKMILLK